MSPRVLQILRWAAYPAFYLFSLAFFAYLTFPHDKLRDRLVTEFNTSQTGPSPSRLELDDVSWYYFTGIEAEGVRWIRPAPEPAAAAEGGKPAAAKPKVLVLDEVHASVSLLRWLFGTTSVSFGVEGLGGEAYGHYVDSGDERELELELEQIDVGQTPLAEMVGLPMTGTLASMLELQMPERDLGKANGKLDLSIEGLTIGDGKAKIRDTIALPPLNVGRLELSAEAADGKLEIKRFSANGPDAQLNLEGQIRLRDSFDNSLAELNITFKFSDAYKNKNDLTRGLFGAPNSVVPGVFDLDPRMKRAKAPDGTYGFRVSGPLSNPSFTPSRSTGGTGAGRSSRSAIQRMPRSR